jgi:hypothetical protein
MAECRPTVVVERQTAKGQVSFRFRTKCTDSTGSFNFQYRFRDRHGNVKTDERSAGWGRTHGSSEGHVDSDLRLTDETLLSVDVITSSVKCTCF